MIFILWLTKMRELCIQNLGISFKVFRNFKIKRAVKSKHNLRAGVKCLRKYHFFIKRAYKKKRIDRNSFWFMSKRSSKSRLFIEGTTFAEVYGRPEKIWGTECISSKNSFKQKNFMSGTYSSYEMKLSVPLHKKGIRSSLKMIN